jgi:hypothetical protein
MKISIRAITTAAVSVAAAASIGLTSMAVASASQVPASTKPAVMAVNHNQGTMSPYRHGSRLYLADGPSLWLSHPHFSRWNATQARATGALWGADSDVFSLGHHVALVFSHAQHHRFTQLAILGGHGVNAHWHLVFSEHAWFGGR